MRIASLRRTGAPAVIATLSWALAAPANAAGVLDLEAGLVIPGYNDVAVPGDTGTRFSLTDDLAAERPLSLRIRYGHTLNERHWVAILAAPLTVRSRGQFNRPIDFNGARFPANSPVDARFRFDSYRLIYRYLWLQRDAFQFSIGGALKLRDAAIELRTEDLRSEKSNVGVVPLLSFNLTWRAQQKLRFVIDGEALAAPQGRAEDVLFAARYAVNDSLALTAGYRILEGGADNDEVYTFSLFHSVVAGARWTF